jgi:hypothetical protein
VQVERRRSNNVAIQRINDDYNQGRGGSAFDPQHTNAPADARGGFGAETTGVTDSQLSGNVHSARGFRRALKQTQQRGNSLKSQLPSKRDTSGPSYKKPNYFSQGANRHGMHIGSGAPVTTSDLGGADTGGAL